MKHLKNEADEVLSVSVLLPLNPKCGMPELEPPTVMLRWPKLLTWRST